MTTQIGIFSTRFKASETEFTAKTSLRTFLTIYMALSQRLTRVGKDPYLFELSELHQIGVHAYLSPRRTALLLGPKRTDGPNAEKSREKSHFLSLDSQTPSHCIYCSSHCPFCVFEKKTLLHFVFILINNFQNSLHVPLS